MSKESLSSSALSGPAGAVEHEAIHRWFELTYAQYLTIPRSVLQSMPDEWQARFVACLDELDDAIDWRPKNMGCYFVELRNAAGRFQRDPLQDYERGRRRVPFRDAQQPAANAVSEEPKNSQPGSDET